MKKEYFAIGIIGLFVLGHVLDYAAGPLSIVIKSPFEFTQPEIISRFPFTAVSILIKTIALFSTHLLLFSFVEKKYLAKGLVLLFIAGLFELYAIQQLATGMTMIPIQWTLALTVTGLLLLIPALIFLVLGLISIVLSKSLQNSEKDEA